MMKMTATMLEMPMTHWMELINSVEGVAQTLEAQSARDLLSVFSSKMKRMVFIIIFAVRTIASPVIP